MYIPNGLRGKYIRTKECREKTGRTSLGRKFSLETKKQMSETRQREDNPNWKGGKADYQLLHIWVRKNLPKPELCSNCNKVPPIDVANISQQYKKDITDFEWLCRRCHMIKDGRMKNFIKKQTDNSL